MKARGSSRNEIVGGLLVSGRLITSEQYEWLMRDTELTRERIEDAIIYRGLLPELDLLKFLASHHRTRFVSTDRLSKAEIDKATLGMVPRQVAETFCVFPVIFEPPTATLSVVTPDPDSPALKEIRGMSAARDIKALVARPAAVRAAIAKCYGGDAHAFSMLGTVMQYQGPRGPDPEKVPMPSARPPTNAKGRGREDVPMVLELDDGPIAGRANLAPAPVARPATPPIARPAQPPPPPPPPKAQPAPKPPPPKAQPAAAPAPPPAPGPAPAVAPKVENFPPEAPSATQRAAPPPAPAAASPAPAAPTAVEAAPRAGPGAETAPPPRTASPPPPPAQARSANASASAAHAKPTLMTLPAVTAEAIAAAQAAASEPPSPADTPTAPPPDEAPTLVTQRAKASGDTPTSQPGPVEEPPSSRSRAAAISRVDPPSALPSSKPLGAIKLTRAAAGLRAALEIQAPQRPSSIPPASARATQPPGAGQQQRAMVDPESVSELVNVLVSLLDSARQDLRGHSALVGRLVRRLGERLSLPPATVATIVLGAQLHDVGKGGSIHLTPLNVTEYESYKAAALKALMTPTRLLAGAHLPADALEAVEQMYERYDGSGIPNGLKGKEIVLGARVIAIADAYADLLENTGNEFRRQLTPQEACGVLVKQRGIVFDPHLVDLFKSLVLGDDVRARLLSNRHRALLVDADAEETTVLELRLIEQGFEVRTVRTVELATKALSEGGEFDLVVSELEIGRGDGLQLLERARKEPWGKELPWVVYTRRQVRDDAQRAFELGVIDFVAKPAQPDVFVAKLKALLEQRSAKKSVGGVSGSLKEMGLPDLVQILSQGRKTGSLRIRAGGESGEIHFDAGAVAHALWGSLKGDLAFFAMVKLQDGEFSLDPQFKPTERTIKDSAEGLLLEGLRRLDEGL